MSLLTFQNVGFGYSGRPPTFVDLSFQIQPGDRLGLVGPNGAGKTTLFLLACGVLAPQQGLITLGNSPVTPGNFHPEIGLVFQNADDQLFCPTVADDVAFGPTEMGLSREQIYSQVDQALDATGITHLADLPPHQLSGGQKRMVAIAGILACQPSITLYDEPSANLDAPARNRLIHFLQRSTQPQTGTLEKGFIVSSHDLHFVCAVCNRVILLSAGQIIADGAPKTVLGNHDLMKAYGMDPPTF
ncbi:MAG: energy-coupling factor ABC transporter ATP-binding protein [Cyanobacteria bacterium P01_F01_bin.153]